MSHRSLVEFNNVDLPYPTTLPYTIEIIADSARSPESNQLFISMILDCHRDTHLDMVHLAGILFVLAITLLVLVIMLLQHQLRE